MMVFVQYFMNKVWPLMVIDDWTLEALNGIKYWLVWKEDYLQLIHKL